MHKMCIIAWVRGGGVKKRGWGAAGRKLGGRGKEGLTPDIVQNLYQSLIRLSSVF